MIAIFAEMGFAVAEGPDIEDDFHNFTALNFPPKHPAREMHDTFFFDPGRATASARCCAPTPARCRCGPCSGPTRRRRRRGSPPARRRRSASSRPAAPIASDSDATHTPMFHQMEGLVIDRDIHMGHLKWTLETFIAPLLRDRRAWSPASARTTSRSPSPRPRWTCSATAPAATMKIGQGDRLAGDRRLRHGAPQRAAQLRPRPRRVAGLRLRLRRRPPGPC